MLSCMQSASLCHNSFLSHFSPPAPLLFMVLLYGANANCYSANVVVEKFSVSIELGVTMSVRVAFLLVDSLCLSSAAAILCSSVWPLSQGELAYKINILLF